MLRRRLRRARRMRESLMTELGALVMEMHRQGRHNPALVERKAREALVADREAIGLARSLGEGQGVYQVIAAGIVGGCRACGGLLATDDRFCPRCGAATLAARNGAPTAVGAPAVVAAPPPDAASRVPATGATPPPPPPDPAARVATAPAAAPPDPTTRVAPPDPSTREARPGAPADPVQMATTPRP